MPDVISHIETFRNYFHYHIKASKVKYCLPACLPTCLPSTWHGQPSQKLTCFCFRHTSIPG